MVQVTLYGAFQDLAGWRQKDTACATLGELEAWLAIGNPLLAERISAPSTLVILNAELAPRLRRPAELPLAPSDRIAFGPPVSGG